MIVYIARQEVLGVTKARLVWPKELQLISRQTDKQVKKLATLFKKGMAHFTEPFSEEHHVANEQQSYN